MASSLNSRLSFRRCILDLRSGENLNSMFTKPAAAQLILDRVKHYQRLDVHAVAAVRKKCSQQVVEA